jgi:hypothetical protein
MSRVNMAMDPSAQSAAWEIGMKAFYVIIVLTSWQGHMERHVRPAGWMTEHQCHLTARRIEMSHPHTEATCQVEHHQ